MTATPNFKIGAAPATESISASPGIEGGAGANPVFAAPRSAAAGQEHRAAVGSPFHSRAEAATAIRQADLLILTFLFLIMIGGYHVHAMLTMGDWDFWVDWKDRRMWPTVLPIMLVTFPAAAQYFFWENFRLPFGATFLCVALLFGEWIDRYINFWGWTYYPINLVWPTSLVPQALFLDIVLLLSKSFIVTAIVGSMGFSLLLYPNNWVILAQYHQPTEQYGTLMSLADVIGFHNVRTSMPEYIRIIERGTMRTFGKDVVGVAAFFSGFVSIIVYFVWWYVGKMFSTVKYMNIDNGSFAYSYGGNLGSTGVVIAVPFGSVGRNGSGVTTAETAESRADLYPKRNVNAWIDDPCPTAGRLFRISINIGVPNDSAAASVPFVEPDWHGVDFIDLGIAVSSIDCAVVPLWRELRLPRTGDSETIVFEVTANVAGTHEFSITVFLLKQMIQLQSLVFTVTVAAAQVELAGAQS